eukprot:1605190-Heterocapsa_arctica.AAC.1
MVCNCLKYLGPEETPPRPRLWVHGQGERSKTIEGLVGALPSISPVGELAVDLSESRSACGTSVQQLLQLLLRL